MINRLTGTISSRSVIDKIPVYQKLDLHFVGILQIQITIREELWNTKIKSRFYNNEKLFSFSGLLK